MPHGLPSGANQHAQWAELQPFQCDAFGEAQTMCWQMHRCVRRAQSSFLGKHDESDCIAHPRDPACLEAPAWMSFHGGIPIRFALHGSTGKCLTAWNHVALAETREELTRGLEGRTKLGQDEALLLRFQGPPSRKWITMQNTPQPLDIGFFDSDGKLLEVLPLQARWPHLYSSRRSDVSYALEAPPGSFKENGIQPGHAWASIATGRAGGTRTGAQGADAIHVEANDFKSFFPDLSHVKTGEGQLQQPFFPDASQVQTGGTEDIPKTGHEHAMPSIVQNL
eukprot:TRINITY_DN113848_c0_g1_i1.p1 TRINITY_DN113848_c0_g1~~TRINITY_DN113848_c0_g1_i1.p1  ORF type:complete len:280 (-),score=51.42 TRINITY_DN113848_c0_g1_i1:32-871(-)